MEAIVAVFPDWGIGSEGTQQVVLKADRQHFRRMTKGCALIVGRKTLEDFPGGKPLKGRHNIVITRQDVEIEGAQVVHSTQEALEAAGAHSRCLLIGGASIYRQFFPYLKRVYVTKIDLTPKSDSFFPNLDADESWQLSESSDWQEENGVRYCFCRYDRI